MQRAGCGESPEAIRMVFTGYADIKSVVDAINQGQIFRYLTKPWDPDELCAVLHEACAQYERIAEQYLLSPSRPRSPRKQPHFFAVLRNKFNAGFLQCVANSFHSLLRNLPTLFFEIYDS